jgi:hypothetical protein
MAGIREPDTVTWVVTSDEPVNCLKQRFSGESLPCDCAFTYRHDICACWEEWRSLIWSFIREKHHIWSIMSIKSCYTSKQGEGKKISGKDEGELKP